MCYPCTSCGRCGKFDPNSPLYAPPPTIPCLKCGGNIDPTTGCCEDCGDQAFTPTAGMLASANSMREEVIQEAEERVGRSGDAEEAENIGSASDTQDQNIAEREEAAA